jgi:predicted MFS family arabinose efflux permease
MAAFFIQTYGMTVGDTAVPLTMVGIGAMLGNLLGGRIVSLARG